MAYARRVLLHGRGEIREIELQLVTKLLAHGYRKARHAEFS